VLGAGGRGSLERRLGRLRLLREGLPRWCSRSGDPAERDYLDLGEQDARSRDPRSSHRCRLSLCRVYGFSPVA
jgi:hypothetical protein